MNRGPGGAKPTGPRPLPGQDFLEEAPQRRRNEKYADDHGEKAGARVGKAAPRHVQGHDLIDQTDRKDQPREYHRTDLHMSTSPAYSVTPANPGSEPAPDLIRGPALAPGSRLVPARHPAKAGAGTSIDWMPDQSLPRTSIRDRLWNDSEGLLQLARYFAFGAAASGDFPYLSQRGR